MAQSLRGYAHLPQWVMCYVQQELTILTMFFTIFYARQWYDVINDVTHVSMTVEDPLLIKALHTKKGLRCGSNDCGISCQTLETMHVFTHEKTYEQPFFGNHVNINK